MKQSLFFILSFLLFHVTLFSQDIRFHHDINYPLNFNNKLPIGFEIVTAEGAHLATKGLLKGNISWKDLEIKVTGGAIREGILYIDSAHKAVDQRKVRIDVFYPNLNIRKTIDVEMKFDGFQLASFKPAQAKRGKSRGSRIFCKFLGMLQDGKTGGDGHNGSDGPILRVVLSMREIDGKDILEAAVTNVDTKKTGTFLVDPYNATLLILADGGDGGSGGSGGEGCSEDDEDSNGGPGGNGGKGGRGGVVSVYAGPGTHHFLHCISFSNKGGSGGSGGSGGTRGGSKAHDGEEGQNGEDGPNGPVIYYTNK